MVSTVGSTFSGTAIDCGFQRKSFYANGRFWVFFIDGDPSYNWVYRSSTDGSTWTEATVVKSSIVSGYRFSIWFDGTYVHYAYAYSSNILYRRGTPNADGTITWSAVEQSVSTIYGAATYPFISVDSSGYVWIGYIDNEQYPYVIKSGNNNGTWGTTPSGFPYLLNIESDPGWLVSIIPLTYSKMLAIYGYDSGYFHVKRWNGAWGTERTVSFYNEQGYHSAVAVGDDVHFVQLQVVTENILHVKYNYSSDSFDSNIIVQSGVTNYSSPVLGINQTDSSLYCFWAGSPTSNHIYYKKYVGGAWDTNPTDWITETTLTANYHISCFYGGLTKLGCLYLINASHPFDVRFAYVDLSAPTPEYTDHSDESLEILPRFQAFNDKVFMLYAHYTGLQDGINDKNLSVSPSFASHSDLVFSIYVSIPALTSYSDEIALNFLPRLQSYEDKLFESTPRLGSLKDKLLKSIPRFDSLKENIFKVYVTLPPGNPGTYLYEYDNTGDTFARVIRDTIWRAATFTASSNHNIKSVKFRLYRIDNPGEITVGIRATDIDGLPTGEDLTNGTTDGNGITANTLGEWKEISLTSYDLTSGVKYAIVVRAPQAGYSPPANYNSLWWRVNPVASGELSGDSGVSWSSWVNEGPLFEVWGDPPPMYGESIFRVYAYVPPRKTWLHSAAVESNWLKTEGEETYID